MTTQVIATNKRLSVIRAGGFRNPDVNINTAFALIHMEPQVTMSWTSPEARGVIEDLIVKLQNHQVGYGPTDSSYKLELKQKTSLRKIPVIPEPESTKGKPVPSKKEIGRQKSTPATPSLPKEKTQPDPAITDVYFDDGEEDLQSLLGEPQPGQPARCQLGTRFKSDNPEDLLAFVMAIPINNSVKFQAGITPAFKKASLKSQVDSLIKSLLSLGPHPLWKEKVSQFFAHRIKTEPASLGDLKKGFGPTHISKITKGRVDTTYLKLWVLAKMVQRKQ